MQKHLILFFLLSLFGNIKTEICPFSEQTFSSIIASSRKKITDPQAIAFLEAEGLAYGRCPNSISYEYDPEISDLGAKAIPKGELSAQKDTILLHGGLYKLLEHVVNNQTPYTHTEICQGTILEMTTSQADGEGIIRNIFGHEQAHFDQPNVHYCSWKDTIKNLSIGVLSLTVAVKYHRTRNMQQLALFSFGLISGSKYMTKAITLTPIEEFHNQAYQETIDYEILADKSVRNDAQALRGGELLYQFHEKKMIHTSASFWRNLFAQRKYAREGMPIDTTKSSPWQHFAQENPVKAYHMIYGEKPSHPSFNARYRYFGERLTNLEKNNPSAAHSVQSHITIIDKKTNMPVEEFTL
jgi:hypothetical protein